MRIPTPIQALSAAAALALLAGCSSGAVAPSGSTSGPGSIHQSGVRHYTSQSVIPKGFVGVRSSHGLNFVAPNTIPGGLYATTFYGTSIYEYKIPNKLNAPPKCTEPTASSFPNGINVGPHRVLWDPDGGTRTIIPFGPNCGAQGTAIASFNGNQPADVAFDGSTMYVADVNLPGVDVYVGGVYSTSLTNAALTGSCFGVAVINHNVFASSNSNQMVEYVGGAEPGINLIGSGMTGTGAPGGMTGDQHNNLIVVDIFNGILKYAPPYTQAPSKVTAPVGSSVYAHLDKTHEFLYVGDFGNGAIDVYTYPGMHYKYSVNNGLAASLTVEGVAVDFIGSN